MIGYCEQVMALIKEVEKITINWDVNVGLLVQHIFRNFFFSLRKINNGEKETQWSMNSFVYFDDFKSLERWFHQTCHARTR